MSTTAVKRASFAIEDQKEGGGNLFGSAGPVRCTLIAGKFSKEAPDNYPATGNPIFAWPVFEYDGTDDQGNVAKVQTPQAYSLGSQSGDHFTISDDGDFLIPNDDDAAIVKGCKFGTLASSLQNEGVPKTVLQDFGWSKVVGLVGDFKRVADKERSFAEERKAQQQGKRSFPQSTLVLVKLHAMPGEKAATAPGKSVASTPSTPAATGAGTNATSTGDVDSDAWTYLSGVLAEKGGSLQRGQITLKVSQAAMKDANRQAIARRASEESFIQTLVDAGLVTYGINEKGQPVSIVK